MAKKLSACARLEYLDPGIRTCRSPARLREIMAVGNRCHRGFDIERFGEKNESAVHAEGLALAQACAHRLDELGALY